MMKYLRKLAVENKKLTYYLVACVALGIFALVLRRNIPAPQEVTYPEFEALPQAAAPHPTYHAHELEYRLSEFFSLVDGAGQVRVMISPPAGRETVFAVNTNTSDATSKEQDAQGGTRETRQTQLYEQTVILTDRSGNSYPLILREVEPQATGIVIIAEGGDNPHVRDALTRAARAMLGLEAHMVQVLKGYFP